jgi:hypothetical protein
VSERRLVNPFADGRFEVEACDRDASDRIPRTDPTERAKIGRFGLENGNRNSQTFHGTGDGHKDAGRQH